MMRLLDSFLNRFTTYRLTLYYVASLLALGVVLAIFAVVPGGPTAILFSTALLLAVCLGVNAILSRILRVTTNPESSIITALILALIMGPASIPGDLRHAAVLAAAGAAAVASKYLLALRRQHVFNPAAAGALVSGIVFGTWATWWVGSTALLPLVVIGGFLLARKIARFRLLGSFLLFFLVFNAALGLLQGAPADVMLQSIPFILGQTSLLFFAFVMFTEPASSPRRLAPQLVYAAIVALLYQPQLAMLGANLTPEEALLVGNLFSFIVSPRHKLRAPLKDRREIAAGMAGFLFPKPDGFSFLPGQFMEWSIPVRKGDSRGNRRYFSIASSPTEPDLMIAARIPPRASRYKNELMSLPKGGLVTAAELGGDFVLPRDPRVPLAFVAGGIGITPFRSMLKYLVDRKEKRDIVLLYSNHAEEEILFKDVLEEAACTIGLRVVHTLTERSRLRPGWCGCTGVIDAQMIRREMPDRGSRHFMVSGSPGMVNAVKSALRAAGVPRRHVRTDYFPGYSL